SEYRHPSSPLPARAPALPLTGDLHGGAASQKPTTATCAATIAPMINIFRLVVSPETGVQRRAYPANRMRIV
ncbi:MAG: hypothetical protein KY464_17915, partial [Gemmatimonadetes bacterium]|nr:hypothetical protein [Gemmatimonadota bacterium]